MKFPACPYSEQRQYETKMIRIGDKIVMTSRPVIKKKYNHSIRRKVLVANGVKILR